MLFAALPGIAKALAPFAKQGLSQGLPAEGENPDDVTIMGKKYGAHAFGHNPPRVGPTIENILRGGPSSFMENALSLFKGPRR